MTEDIKVGDDLICRATVGKIEHGRIYVQVNDAPFPSGWLLDTKRIISVEENGKAPLQANAST